MISYLLYIIIFIIIKCDLLQLFGMYTHMIKFCYEQKLNYYNLIIYIQNPTEMEQFLIPCY